MEKVRSDVRKLLDLLVRCNRICMTAVGRLMCVCSMLGFQLMKLMDSMKLVIPSHSLYWSIHTKDESKRGTVFAFIFGVN